MNFCFWKNTEPVWATFTRGALVFFSSLNTHHFSTDPYVSLFPHAHQPVIPPTAYESVPSCSGPNLFLSFISYSNLPYSSRQPGLLSMLQTGLEFSRLCIFAFKAFSDLVLISGGNPTTHPAPEFPQHFLCASWLHSLLCFIVMCVPFGLST